MSIIYDALQKTQRSRKNDLKPTAKRLDVFDIGLLLIIAFLIVLCIFAYLRPVKANKIAAAPAVTAATTIPAVNHEAVNKVAVTKPVPSPASRQILHHDDSLVFNGVYVSAQEKVALINQQEFHLGDTVNGMKIIEISSNHVKLQSDKNTLVLE